MNLRETLLLVHILAVIVWFGGGIMLTIHSARVSKSQEDGAVKAFAEHFEWVGLRVMMPSMLVLIITGIWLVIESKVFGFDQAFVSIGLAVFVISFILGGAFYGPQSKKLRETVTERGASDAAVAALMNRVVLVTRLEVVVIAFAVWAMVTKPGA